MEVAFTVAGLLFAGLFIELYYRRDVAAAKRILRERRDHAQRCRTAKQEGQQPPVSGCDEFLPFFLTARHGRMNPMPRERKLLSGHTEAGS